jgi:hypothetical protein
MIDTCIITKRKFDKTFKYITDPLFNGHKYYFQPVGTVYISNAAEIVINNNTKINLSVIAGLCRCAFELKEEPPIIDSELINSLDTLKSIPRNFKEKYDHFFSIIYKTGGNEYKARMIDVKDDYPLAFANNISELQRIIDFGISSGELECLEKIDSVDVGTLIYVDLKFTPKGLKKADKLINNYFSIIQPKIDSGNTEIDRKINHAVSLFYQDNATIEDKRSASEELSFILEPFRKDMDKYFMDKDVNLFFQLVNEFDIRHNKEKTKRLIYEEQIEWIFQCLLNSLITYIKLKKRFE